MIHRANPRELVQRLILAELIARRGEGPLALRTSALRAGRRAGVAHAQERTITTAASGEPEPR